MHCIEPALQHEIVAMRRDLHRHPELAWKEERTSSKISQFLEKLGIPHRTGVAGTGVIADIAGHAGVPAVALRADMDALPIHEETGLPFASEFDGVMHACGHDGHTSMLLGAASILAQEDHLPAPVRLIFQPAEEIGSGALALIDEGILDGVGMIFGGHLDRHYDTGAIVVTEGPVNAASDRFSINITGHGGHGARPHETVDAVVVGALLVMSIQTIVSREIDPSFPSVISVGRFHAGTAGNVIAGRAELVGTIRTQHPEVRQHLHSSLSRISESVGALHGAKVDLEIREGMPALVNSPEMTSLARDAAEPVVGDKVQSLKNANMGGEDFAHYIQHVPGCYVRFGARTPGNEAWPAHSSRFDFDERALAIGAAYYHQLAHVAGQSLAHSAAQETVIG